MVRLLIFFSLLAWTGLGVYLLFTNNAFGQALPLAMLACALFAVAVLTAVFVPASK